MATLAEIKAYRPKDIEDSLDAMRSALDYFHRENDQRAIFLRAYYLITTAIWQAVHQRGRYDRRIFFDPKWVDKLAGKFSLLYFQSLSTQERGGERAWKTAHRLAASNETSVFQDMLLGINAHINYDLAYGVYLNLEEHDDGRDHLLLPRRKFDHDQVNNVLINTIPQVETVLTRDYGGELQLMGELVGDLDEVLGELGIKYYRERVWWSAISFLSAQSPEELQLVHDRLDWESAQLAESLACEGTVLQRSLRGLLNLFSKTTFGPITLEREDTAPEKKKPTQVFSPF
ncbi:hypothetical protein CYFUS_002942 [Cystobacter fuscus]|uniref:Uncharacterized protein n=1 Tax=Cystobacter fuscus TaxID=43 RepID=A0A250J1W7_9BACT|nr:DUF5995 family protein [Cystobacter fuscus]ATB37520.1 hypothetical protein CYFUS_002942 [Cystobacter fuscus]